MIFSLFSKALFFSKKSLAHYLPKGTYASFCCFDRSLSLSFSFAGVAAFGWFGVARRRVRQSEEKERLTNEWNSSPSDWRIRSFFVLEKNADSMIWVCKNAHIAKSMDRFRCGVFCLRLSLTRAERRRRRKPALSPRRVERRSLSLLDWNGF